MKSVRVLIAIAPRMYGEALAHALRKNRPRAEVLRLEPGELDGQLDGFDPQLLVCNEATEEVRALAPSWVELSYDTRYIEATVSLGGRRSRIENVGVAEMLAVMDEAERLSAAP